MRLFYCIITVELFMLSVVVRAKKLPLEVVTVPLGLGATLDCFGDNAPNAKCTATNVTYEWYNNRSQIRTIPDRANQMYSISWNGSLTIYSVQMHLNNSVFGCRAKNVVKKEICGDYQQIVVVEYCATKTRGGVKSMCKYGSCYIDTMKSSNYSYFKCKCYRFFSGYFCERSAKWSKIIVDVLNPWIPFLIIGTMTVIIWTFASFLGGHSKKARVFSKHKEKIKDTAGRNKSSKVQL